ncbi:YY1-associated factor 2 [Daphnia magna]|uniref:Uncharacterized protein n=2 Tax=Daphnia magna TaxID=35525 RepID=A0ABQ9ZU36_9CRUS|nr:hypothetical protein OUZ56_031094 [Daphnia magna]KZS11736.1 YY1-associated factor 2 [Daphnia magna]
MDAKKGSPNARRAKRSSKQIEENYWDCSVCTYRNNAEAFKCSMCDVRKGTSTRKPRLNPQLVPQVFNPSLANKNRKEKEFKERDKSERKSDGNTTRNSKARPRLKNVDRSTAMHKEVTVNNVTVVITEFRPKISTKSTSPSNLDLDAGHTTSSSSSASNHGNDLSPADQEHSD